MAMNPAKPPVFPLPANGQCAVFNGKDGWPLRSIIWCPADAREMIVLLNGRGDFIEKYAEFITTFVHKGYGVAAMDWRGQGLSGEVTVPPRRTHIEDFGLWLDDAQQWINKILTVHYAMPLKLVAHSMGSHLALRLMHDRPGLFERAVLMAPMLALQTHPFSNKFSRRVANLAVEMGQGERFCFGQLPYSALFSGSLRMGRLTSDKARFDQEGAAIAANPALAIGGASFGWLKAAFQSCAILASAGYAESIAT
jgi:lysophospholipase